VFLVESSVTTHMCPICQATLAYRDSRPRIRKSLAAYAIGREEKTDARKDENA